MHDSNDELFIQFFYFYFISTYSGKGQFTKIPNNDYISKDHFCNFENRSCERIFHTFFDGKCIFDQTKPCACKSHDFIWKPTGCTNL